MVASQPRTSVSTCPQKEHVQAATTQHTVPRSFLAVSLCGAEASRTLSPPASFCWGRRTIPVESRGWSDFTLERGGGLGAVSSSPGDPSPATRIPRKPRMWLHYERPGCAPLLTGPPFIPIRRCPGTVLSGSRRPSKARHLQTLRLYTL